jgi:hypothetical protein
VSFITHPRCELTGDNAYVRANIDCPIPWADSPQDIAWNTEADSRKPLAFHRVAQVCCATVSGGIDKLNRAFAGMPMKPYRGAAPATGQSSGNATYNRPSVHAANDTDEGVRALPAGASWETNAEAPRARRM